MKCPLALRHNAGFSLPAARDAVAVARLAGGSGKPDRWQSKLTTLLESQNPATVTTVGSVLEIMANTIGSITFPTGWMPFLPWAANEKLASGALVAYGWWMARTTAPDERASAVELCERLAWWGARWDSIRPVSGPTARGAAMALGDDFGSRLVSVSAAGGAEDEVLAVLVRGPHRRPRPGSRGKPT
jgi:hypothetical protein